MIGAKRDNTAPRASDSDGRAIATPGPAQALPLPDHLPTRDFLTRIRSGMVELLTSLECANSVQGDVWDFAVEISRLRKTGLAENEFRWLVSMNYVAHAQEVTKPKEDGRQFRQTGKLSFARRTCFVLTEVGADFARTVVRQVRPAEASARQASGQKASAAQSVPTWDPLRRELRMNGRVIKRFRWTAKNQERILATFDEEGWPCRIDDPIPPQPNGDQRQKLRDAVRALNQSHEISLIRFRGDGSGQGVVWELIEGADP